jgi:hypothetical protein
MFIKVPQLYHGLQLKSITLLPPSLTIHCNAGPIRQRSGPAEKSLSGPSAKNLHAELERLSLSFRVTWAWSERVNLYN